MPVTLCNYICILYSQFGTIFPASATPFLRHDAGNVASQFWGKSDYLSLMTKHTRNIENYWQFIWYIHAQNWWFKHNFNSIHTFVLQNFQNTALPIMIYKILPTKRESSLHSCTFRKDVNHHEFKIMPSFCNIIYFFFSPLITEKFVHVFW